MVTLPVVMESQTRTLLGITGRKFQEVCPVSQVGAGARQTWCLLGEVCGGTAGVGVARGCAEPAPAQHHIPTARAKIGLPVRGIPTGSAGAGALFLSIEQAACTATNTLVIPNT